MSFIGNGNTGGATGSAGSALTGGLPSLGSLASLAGQATSLAGIPAAGGLSKAVQLAQTGMALMGKTPASIADALNSVGSGPARLTQDFRYVTIDTPLGKDALLVNALIADEHVNQLPEISVDLLSHQDNIEARNITGQFVKLTLDPQSRNNSLTRVVAGSSGADERRYFNGYVVSFARNGNSGSVTRYEMTVVPWLWFLTRSTDCRIFQQQTPVEILTTIFHELGFSDFEFQVRSPRPALKYIVMYGESYYNFCARLMEQEGLIWTFRFEKDKHVLVIGDTNSMFVALPTLGQIDYHANSSASEQKGISEWNEAFSFRVGKIAFRDFNPEQPSSRLMEVESPVSDSIAHANLQATERYEYHSLYDLHDDGNRYVRYAMEAEEAQARSFTGGSYVPGMTTVGRFTLENHDSSAWNGKEFVILRVRHHAVNDYTQQPATLPYVNTFTCLPADTPFRPERRIPKPSMQGTQTATVVGPAGEEIYTDGSSVKLHFPWDRRGKSDGTDSMWIRVSQPWAGKGYGGSAIPRIGQEVVVSFSMGDPDVPLVIGRVFNGDLGNPYHGTAGQTMGIKSQTHKGEGSNELRMSDVNGAQELYLHAQKDMNTVVQDAQSTRVLKGDRSVKVEQGDYLNHVDTGHLVHVVAQGNTLHQTPNGVHTVEAKELWINVGGKGGTKIHMTGDTIEIYKGDSKIYIDTGNIKVQAARTDINPNNK